MIAGYGNYLGIAPAGVTPPSTEASIQR